MRKPMLGALLVAVATLTTACGTTGGAGGSTEGFEAKDPLTIGYSTYDLQNPYWQNYLAGVQAEAEAQGIEVLVADQKSSPQAQVSGSSDLINQGISGLIVSPVEPAALPATVTAAHNANIPIVVGDVGAEGDYDAFILSDNAKGGADAADHMAEQLAARGGEGPKKVGIITLHPGSAVGVDRVAGFKEQVEAEYPDIEVVAELNGNDTIKEGRDAAASMLAAHPDLAGIYAANDNEAQGAIAAIQEAGLDPAQVVTIGFDGNALSIEAIGEGTQTATIAQDPYGQGQLAVQVTMQLLEGEDVDFTDPETNTIEFPIELVTADNLAAFTQAREGQA